MPCGKPNRPSQHKSHSGVPCGRQHDEKHESDRSAEPDEPSVSHDAILDCSVQLASDVSEDDSCQLSGLALPFTLVAKSVPEDLFER